MDSKRLAGAHELNDQSVPTNSNGLAAPTNSNGLAAPTNSKRLAGGHELETDRPAATDSKPIDRRSRARDDTAALPFELGQTRDHSAGDDFERPFDELVPFAGLSAETDAAAGMFAPR